MENQSISMPKVLAKVLELIIIKPLILPFQIYKSSLIKLSNTASDDSDETNLGIDFPIYVWYISTLNAMIVLSWLVGLFVAIGAANKVYYDVASTFLSILVATYFFPLIIGLIRELMQITLKILLYLKIISKK